MFGPIFLKIPYTYFFDFSPNIKNKNNIYIFDFFQDIEKNWKIMFWGCFFYLIFRTNQPPNYLGPSKLLGPLQTNFPPHWYTAGPVPAADHISESMRPYLDVAFSHILAQGLIQSSHGLNISVKCVENRSMHCVVYRNAKNVDTKAIISGAKDL